ncbi:electron transport complex subunit E [Pseudoalteromonas luteoviolacea]|uniref:Ion-translocating oxidoreductase complex subunit E n=1 Tax=Pseudoalteromonas luteoviolacea S4054 TaxID=1129367 RepID=A0A0F6AIT9_9GAMM|nr:electron transport complex subunit E [Pseudoalteromonas luteoviolacea]AOT09512.1 electron transport complex subunit RsxE [Pseudoalteromonas luteoviolacea]AOT14424.1 electron transport complex subunit RsxE [Pseudoalteromonas luteoviolacea]AOT19340.1 electron transport complex subunit RsxE [Pseudoalteromonas luteoviolacea]KKE85729.1 electron transporter RsxE [Pseudoalteromonas luteoviolacea S4054]KZN65313.1 electron transporter RsxE [Pseudoalteromonas luteoviolacea S4047-1]
MSEYKTLAHEGLWKNNAALVQLLGLCPLLAVTSTVTNALGLGIATLLVLVGSNVTVSIVRNWVPKDIRIPVFVMIIAAFVTIIQLLMNAYTFGLYQSLGIFIPLIVTNCAIIGRAEAYASKNPPILSAWDGVMMGLGFAAVLVILGAMRELIGQGTLFDGAELLLGDWATALRIEVLSFDSQFLVAVLPPGAFLGLGLIIAAKNYFDERQKAQAQPTAPAEKAERARVTSLT